MARTVSRFSAAAFLTVLTVVGTSSSQRFTEPFVPIAVSYTIDPSASVDRDLEAIRGLGFNSIRTIVRWPDAEPARGEFRLQSLDAVLDAAAKADLKVIVEIDSGSAPSWLLRKFPDGRFQPDDLHPWLPPAGGRTNVGPKPDTTNERRACLDHPGVRDAAKAFVAAVSERAAKVPATYSIDVASDAARGLCSCRYTKKRFDDWSSRGGHGTDRSASRLAFVALERANDLRVLADAAAGRGPRILTSYAAVPSVLGAGRADWAGQDDRLMTAIVDRYGTSFDPTRGERNPQASVALPLALDAIRSAAEEKGWLLSEASAPAGAAGSIAPSAADLRLRGWTAVSRGARGVTFPDWRTLGPPSGAIDNRARAAGAFASVITRNPALFAPLRPRPSSVAIVYDTHAASPPAEMARLYRILFERNIQVDFVDAGDVDSGKVGRYKAIIDARTQPLTPDSLVTQLTRAGVAPDIRIAATRATIEMRVLESAEVIALVGLNHSTTAERVELHFPPDTQEAIWQNMETGAAVNFVAGRGGPTYTHLFQPKDALVLVIRKGIR